jgi:hypothetical protein
MIKFVKGIFFDQLIGAAKMLDELHSPEISKDIDEKFLKKTIEDLSQVSVEIQQLIDSGDLEIEPLAPNNIIKYNTFHESLLKIELFRYLVVINYGRPEEYFKKKITRIYAEINCLQKTPIITTISNSDNYYWALPMYDIIAVPTGEEKNLLNLPDLFHEMGHLIYNQYEVFLKGNIDHSIRDFYQKEILRVHHEQRPVKLITFFQEKESWWISSWVMEFTCDLIATYLVGPAYAWTNLKLTTRSSGDNAVYMDSPSHPSDESRMVAVFMMLEKMGHTKEVHSIQEDWKKFLTVTKNPIPSNYQYIFPQALLKELVDAVFLGCKQIDLRIYRDQVAQYTSPISKVLNDAWEKIFSDPVQYQAWEKERIKEIEESLGKVQAKS